MTYQLVLMRHGESQWNLENRFTGWVDVPLTPKGEQEAARAGERAGAHRRNFHHRRLGDGRGDQETRRPCMPIRPRRSAN